MGEPAGIGPDLCLLIAEKKAKDIGCELTVIGSQRILNERKVMIGSNVEIVPLKSAKQPPGYLRIIDFNPLDSIPTIVPGIPSVATAKWQFELLKYAIKQVRDNHYSALVTAPIDKYQLAQIDPSFTGFTEYLGKQFSSPVIMLFDNGNHRLALASTHIPLKKVSGAITKSILTEKIALLRKNIIKVFNISNPSICVCGLNPHTGEKGKLGTEEIDSIIPAIEYCKKLGWEVSGPYPADTIYLNSNAKNCSAVLSLYHDQLLPVIKTHSFDSTVNITLGTPIIRTSVDHGTAYSIAGNRSQINTQPIMSAIKKASELSRIASASTH